MLLPAAVIIFPISYIVGDVLTEVYGYRRARRVIWLGFLCARQDENRHPRALVVDAHDWLNAGGTRDGLSGLRHPGVCRNHSIRRVNYHHLVTQWLVNSVLEASVTPLTYGVVNILKQRDGLDVNDCETRFTPLLVEE